LSENQQEQNGHYPGILSEHELQKYLICNNISKCPGGVTGHRYRNFYDRGNVVADGGVVGIWGEDTGHIKRLLKQGSYRSPGQKIVTSKFHHGFKNHNMKRYFTGVLLFLCSSVLAQPTVRDQFQKINTVAEAQAWMAANQQLKPAILHLTAGKDSTLIDKRLLRQNQGDIFSVGYVTYKVLESKESVKYRASYIYLDGSTLSPSEVDSLRKVIVDKLKAGAKWDQLSDQYTMDGNTTHGDTGWFFGELQMPKEFQDAVKAHNLGDIFFVDVSERNWHYIVKKTYNDDDQKDATILRANGR